jgi:hypothetical protein
MASLFGLAGMLVVLIAIVMWDVRHTLTPLRWKLPRWNWVAAFTGLLFVATCTQAWAFIASERAFVSTSGPTTVPIRGLSTTQPLNFEINVRNDGRSTAVIMHSAISILLLATPLPSPPQYVGADIYRGPLVAGGVTKATTRGFGVPPVILSPDQVTDITNGTKKLYVYGYIRYEDDYSLFGYRVTGFCYVFNSDSTNNLGVSQFYNCNDADEYIYAHSTWR